MISQKSTIRVSEKKQNRIRTQIGLVADAAQESSVRVSEKTQNRIRAQNWFSEIDHPNIQNETEQNRVRAWNWFLRNRPSKYLKWNRIPTRSERAGKEIKNVYQQPSDDRRYRQKIV